jgi:hypothetical protein
MINGEKMTIEELERRLPDGFHDIYLLRFAVDLTLNTCAFDFKVDFQESRKLVKLSLRGLSLCVVEPSYPDIDYFPSEARPVLVKGVPTSEKILPSLTAYSKLAPPGSFFYSFFLDSRNSFIHVGATDAELEIECE